MKLKVKKLDDKAQLPTRAKPHSSGLDLHALLEAGRWWIHPGERAVIRTGIAIELPSPVCWDEGTWEAFEAQIRPRSGMTSNGLVAAVGTIDNDYRGEIRVTLFNHSFDRQYIEQGQRIAQLVIAPVVYPELEEVAELSPTERGEAGFGSTGK